MSETTDIISILENRVSNLVLKLKALEQNNAELKQNLIKSENLVDMKNSEITELNAKYNALKTANSLLGSEENKRDTKLKINALIREIDYCIAQLSD
jgi:hypothetical protein